MRNESEDNTGPVNFFGNKKLELHKTIRVRVTLKSSSEQRVRFYSLERSSPLLDIGQRTKSMGHGTWDIGHRT